MAKNTAKPKPKNTARPSGKHNSTPAPTPHDTLVDDMIELLTTGIRELYWIENHLVQVLPKIQESAGASPLKKAIGDHLKVTRGHVTRLHEVFDLLGLAPQAKKSDGLEGLVIEGEGIINSTAPGSEARDAGLIMACQKVETYEFTAYKGLGLLASRLGEQAIADLLEQTMAEEQEAEDVLEGLA